MKTSFASGGTRPGTPRLRLLATALTLIGTGAVPAAAEPAATSTQDPATFRVTRTQARVPPRLAQAYDQLNTNRPDLAADNYRQVLRDDPMNVDALLGMAAIAVRQQQTAPAEHWYRRALAADPGSIDAQAALIGLRGYADPDNAESRLKTLLAANPDAAVLHFTLGNLYAANRRWPEAHRAYVSAHVADESNPDYLFNLAVSLDHLHQPTAALNHYEAALHAIGKRPSHFDVERVRARLEELKAASARP